MFSLSYKNRIAFNYILSTGLLFSVVFFVIYIRVDYSVHNHIDDDLKEEIAEHLNEIKIDRNNSYLIQVDQWREIENNIVNVNAVFVQFLDINNQLIDKSPNLKGLQLKLYDSKSDNKFIDTYLNGKPIRQIQVPLIDQNKIIGRLFIAMSLVETVKILKNLQNTLYISFPLILLLLFFIARFIAGKSIKPVSLITEFSSKITKDNLNKRIALPQHKDELYVLSKTINDLLDRIENAVEREKQFTSAASHELRTPLAVIKGTLEVLIRKQRSQNEYEEKIQYCVMEVDRLNSLVDQLLLLARFENQKQNIQSEIVFLNALILDSLTRFSEKINTKNITISTQFAEDFYINSDHYLLSIILSNLFSNAIKYSKQNGEVKIMLSKQNNTIVCIIADNGIGIAKEDIDKVFNSFYRSKHNEHPEIKGSGLGLSIVKRLAELLDIQFEIQSKNDKGTKILLRFY